MISKAWVSRQLPFIQKNIKIDNTKRTVYHISMDPLIKEFIPMISLSAANSEDRTVPRINVGSTLADSMYAVYDVTVASRYGEEEMGGRKGAKNPIWTIYMATVDAVVIPNNKLVYDATYTNELWLVADKPENMSRKFDKGGEFFIVSNTNSYGVERGEDNTTWLVKVNKGASITLDGDIELSAGCYRCTAPTNFGAGKRMKFTFKPMGNSDYSSIRKLAIKAYKELQ